MDDNEQRFKKNIVLLGVTKARMYDFTCSLNFLVYYWKHFKIAKLQSGVFSKIWFRWNHKIRPQDESVSIIGKQTIKKMVKASEFPSITYTQHSACLSEPNVAILRLSVVWGKE